MSSERVASREGDRSWFAARNNKEIEQDVGLKKSLGMGFTGWGWPQPPGSNKAGGTQSDAGRRRVTVTIVQPLRGPTGRQRLGQGAPARANGFRGTFIRIPEAIDGEKTH